MRTVSIMGDSVSTFEGYNPEGYEVYYDKECQIYNEMEDVQDTWWMQVLEAIDGKLCINNAFSGSVISDKKFPGALSEKRLANLKDGEQDPNYMLVYMGYNDQRNSVKVNTSKRSVYVFDGAYRALISELMIRYPNAHIVCGTLLTPMKRNEPGYVFPENANGKSLEDYNRVIREAVKEKGVILADLAAGNVKFESKEGLHPTKAGHKTIAEEWIRCMMQIL